MAGRLPTKWVCQFYPEHEMTGKNGYCKSCGSYSGWKVETWHFQKEKNILKKQ
jgi:hypothetical protein